jgi:peptide/nickel transport system ATP-binding protein
MPLPRGSLVRANRPSFDGQDIADLADLQWRRLRGKHIGFVRQDALVSLDQPRQVGQEIGEARRVHGVAGTRAQLAERVVALLRLVGVPEPEIKARQLPHELSGGQRQRALIAAAIALDPALLIADEPTTALDVTVQAQILALLDQARARGKALILISHDLAVVSRMADDVVVMKDGEVVEHGAADQIFGDPQHEYTERLLAAIPSVYSRGKRLSPNSAMRFITPGPKLGVARTNPPAAKPGPSEPLLEASNLVKRFRGPDRSWRTVVRDVSFTLRAGETLGIVGESGSGKSTVARMALALEIPDAGEVRLDGHL